ncbi:hypothetical protein PCE1_002105 [Barthelona sp. PCE]
MSKVPIFNQEWLQTNIDSARKHNVYLPTFEQLRNPDLIPQCIKDELLNVDKEEVHPLNLFRISWFNENKGFKDVPEHIVLPSELTGVPCKIVVLPGARMPSNTHKSGPAYSNFVSKIIAGSVDVANHRVLFPSTGNYCRGGVLISKMLGAKPVAVLPEEMSQERFDYMERLGAEIIKTYGCESNVREIFEECEKLDEDPNCVVCNQFSDTANPVFHYACTGDAFKKVWEHIKDEDERARLFGCYMSQGSAGTLAAGDYMKKHFPNFVLGVGESRQVPTLWECGFGNTTTEGVSDKHVPLVFNVRNMDFLSLYHDPDVMNCFRLFNEEEGKAYLLKKGIPQETIDALYWFGLSSCANVIGCIKMAKYYELTEEDVVFTVATDSSIMYMSVLEKMRAADGTYNETMAAVDHNVTLLHQRVDYSKELNYTDRKRMHNLKYFTWVEQRGIDVEVLNSQWYEHNYFEDRFGLGDEYDKLIAAFNKQSGLLDKYQDEYQASLL